MKRFKLLKKDSISKFPQKPGVYVFKKNKDFLYIGKAINLKRRANSHFQKTNYRDNLFIDQVKTIGYIETNSEIEALILEANLIKKYRPKYNIVWKDDKNYFYVGITKAKLPQIFWTHQLKTRKIKEKAIFIGPFVNGSAIKSTLKVLRRAFPYYTVKKHSKTLCPWCYLNLCPGPNPNKKEYQKNIKGLISVLMGNGSVVLKNLKREMEAMSKSQKFERAAKKRDQISALEKILENTRLPMFKTINLKRQIKFTSPKNVFRKTKQKTLSSWKKTESELKKILKIKKNISRIEAYDISDICGKFATGSMVVFLNGKPEKELYRRFKIKISGKPNDTAMIKEILNRRLKHLEWTFPSLILIDGGKPQLSAALLVKKEESIAKKIIMASIAKKHNKLHLENYKEALLLENLPREIFNLVLHLRDESHRFAITYHKKLRRKELLS
jgi:excinuclease ABC subunit C